VKKCIVFFLIAAVLPSCEKEPVSNQDQPAVLSQPSESPPIAGEALLALANHCALELFPKSLGTGGNPLRFDSLKLSPYGHHFGAKALFELPEAQTPSWHVRIEEEPPHSSIPNGVEFSVNPSSGACGHVSMD